MDSDIIIADKILHLKFRKMINNKIYMYKIELLILLIYKKQKETKSKINKIFVVWEMIGGVGMTDKQVE